MGLYDDNGKMTDPMNLGYMGVHPDMARYAIGGSETPFYDRYTPRTERELQAFQRAQTTFEKGRDAVSTSNSDQDSMYRWQANHEELAGELDHGYEARMRQIRDAIRSNDVVKLRNAVEEMDALVDRHADALQQWVDLRDVQHGEFAQKLSQTAFNMQGREYRRRVFDDVTADEVLNSQSPEAKRINALSAADKIGTSSDDARMLVDRDDPYYSVMSPVFKRFQAADGEAHRMEMVRRPGAGQAQPYVPGQKRDDPVAAAKDVADKARYVVQVAHRVVAGRKPGVVDESKGQAAIGDAQSLKSAQDFFTEFSGLPTASQFTEDQVGLLWDSYYRWGKAGGPNHTPADFFAGLRQCYEAPKVTQKSVDAKGNETTVEVDLPGFDPAKAAETTFQVMGRLHEAGRTVNFSELAPIMQDNFRKAASISNMTGRSLGDLGHADAVACASVYKASGYDSSLGAGKDGTDGRFLDNAVEECRGVAKTLGVEADPEGKLSVAHAPAGTHADTQFLVQKVAAVRLAAPSQADKLYRQACDDVAEHIQNSRKPLGALTPGKFDAGKLAANLVDRVIYNFDNGVYGMTLAEMLAANEGGVEVVEDPKTGDVVLRKTISDSEGANDVDPATGKVRGRRPDYDPGFFSTRPELMTSDKVMSSTDRYSAMAALKQTVDDGVPYKEYLDESTRSAVDAMFKGTYSIKWRQYTNGPSWDKKEARVLAPSAGKLLASNLDHANVVLPEKTRAFVESGDFIRFAEGHDRWSDWFGNGDDALLARAQGVAEELAVRIREGVASSDEAMLWARIFVTIGNRDRLVDMSPAEVGLIEKMPVDVRNLVVKHRVSSANAYVLDQSVGPHDMIIHREDLSDAGAEMALKGILKYFHDVNEGWDTTAENDPLARAGYKYVPIGIPTTGDYGGILRKFDTDMRLDHPAGYSGIVSEGQAAQLADAQAAEKAASDRYAREKLEKMSLAHTSNYYLRSMTVGTDTENYLVDRLATLLAPKLGGDIEQAKVHAEKFRPMLEEANTRYGYNGAMKLAKGYASYRRIAFASEDANGNTVYSDAFVPEKEVHKYAEQWEEAEFQKIRMSPNSHVSSNLEHYEGRRLRGAALDSAFEQYQAGVLGMVDIQKKAGAVNAPKGQLYETTHLE